MLPRDHVGSESSALPKPASGLWPSRCGAQGAGIALVDPDGTPLFRRRRNRSGFAGLHRVAKAGEKHSFLGFRRRDRALLDRTKAADLLGNRGNRNRKRAVRRGERSNQFLEIGDVIRDQLALELAFLAVAERIEQGAAEELELRKHTEGGLDPWPEAHLPRAPAIRVLLREQGRRQMKFVAKVAVEGGRDLFFERAIGEEARDFVLVLIGHQL